MVRIGSFNVWGIKDRIKRKKIFNYIKNKNIEICFLLETHSEETDEKQGANESGWTLFFDHGESNARGITMAIAKKLEYKILKITKSKIGRYIIIDLEINNKCITVVNIYALNKDDPEFFIELFKKLTEHKNEEIVICGDLNLVMNPKMDHIDSIVNHHKAVNVLQEFMDTFMIVGIWRLQNPNERKYTWMKYDKNKKKTLGSRIDLFLINYGLSANVNSRIEPGIFSDHSLILLDLKLNTQSKGRGLWKLNTALLHDPKYVKFINKNLVEIIAMFYKHEDDVKWEIMKNEMVNKSIEYAVQKAKDNKKMYNECIKIIEKCNEILQTETKEDILETTNTMLEKKKNIIEKFEYEKCKGAIVRSRTKWYTDSEKNTKYFLGLEKTKYSNKTMKCLIREDGTICRDSKKILLEQRKFYAKLYSKDPNVYFKYINKTDQIVKECDKTMLDSEITKSEFSKALYM